MAVLGIIWVVVSPYLVGLLVARSRHVNRVVGGHLLAASATGWCGLAALVIAAVLVGGRDGWAIALATAPLAGLAFWVSSPGRGPAHEPPPPDDRGPPPPDDFIDWSGFLRDVSRWSAERGGLTPLSPPRQ